MPTDARSRGAKHPLSGRESRQVSAQIAGYEACSPTNRKPNNGDDQVERRDGPVPDRVSQTADDTMQQSGL